MDKKLVLVVLVLLVIGIPLSTYGAVANSETSNIHRVQANAPNTSQQGQITQAAEHAQVTGTISLTKPDGGDLWLPGSTHAISWNYSGYPGNNVKISLFKGSKLVEVLVNSLPKGEDGHGVFNWSIPSDITQAENYVIEVKSVEKPDIKKTSGQFAIHGHLQVTEPTADSDWNPGGNGIIRWTYNAKPGNTVKVTLLKNNAQILTIMPTISIGSGGEGLAAWDIPDNLSLTDSYNIRVQAVEYPFVKATSLNFKLKSKLEISQPNRGQYYYQSGSIAVKGEAYGCGPTITVTLMKRVPANNNWGFSFEAVTSANVSVSNHHFSHNFNCVGLTNGEYGIMVKSAANGSIENYVKIFIN